MFVEMRDAKGGVACRGVRKARLCDGWGCTSRQKEEEAGFEMAVFQKKYVFFPGEGRFRGRALSLLLSIRETYDILNLFKHRRF